MFYNKKNAFRNIVLVLLLCLGCFLQCKAVPIPGFPNPDADSYTISLKGDVLNTVGGLNVIIRINNNKADIKPSVSFSSMGATTILSSVAGPEGDQFTITLALNGAITDGQATITGKFVENSIAPAAEINIVKVTRDGGTDITSQLITDITFTTPAKVSSSSSGSTDPSSSSGSIGSSSSSGSTASNDASQLLVNYLIGDGDQTALQLLNSGSAEPDFVNANTDSLSVKATNNFQLKPKGLNRYFVTLDGILNSKGTEYDTLSCLVTSRIKDLPRTLIDALFSSTFFAPATPTLTVKFPISSFKLRFRKIIKIPLLPKDDGVTILTDTDPNASYDGLIIAVCGAYDSNDPTFVDYIKQNKIKQSNINIFTVIRALDSSKYSLVGSQKLFKVIPPKVANVNQ